MSLLLYDPNSPLEDLEGSNGNIRVVGLQIDRRNGTLWVTSSGTNNLLYAKDNTGTWYAFDPSAVGPVTLGDIAIDDSGQKWIAAPRGTGVVVYNDGETLSNTNDDQSIRLTQKHRKRKSCQCPVFALKQT